MPILKFLSAIASPLQVFMWRMWVSQWNAHSHPPLWVSTWLILIRPLSSFYRHRRQNRWEKLSALQLAQKMSSCWGFIFFIFSSNWIIRICTHSHAPPLFLQSCMCTCVQHINDHIYHLSHRNTLSWVMWRQPVLPVFVLRRILSNWFCRRAGLRIDNSAWVWQLRGQTETWYTQTYFSFFLFFPQPYSCQPSPWIINQFAADKKFISLFKVCFFFSPPSLLWRQCVNHYRGERKTKGWGKAREKKSKKRGLTFTSGRKKKN